jgi:hypothetical protein
MAGASGEVVMYVQEGLGNQLFQYAMARAYALRWGVRLKLDLRHFRDPRNRKFQLDLFNVRYEQFTGSDRIRLALNNSPKLGALHDVASTLGQRGLYKIVKEPQSGFDASALTVRGRRIYFTGFWQCERYFSDAAETIREELKFKQEASGENAAMIERIKSVDAVALHVRRGDYLSVPAFGALIGSAGERYYRAAVELVRQRVRNPHFFVFSDDPQWAIDHLASVEPKTVVSHNAGVQDHEDLRLMNACRHFIIANSSFSWWGAWLASDAEKMVIAPGLWFSDGRHSGRDIVPDGWTKL